MTTIAISAGVGIVAGWHVHRFYLKRVAKTIQKLRRVMRGGSLFGRR